MGRAGSGRASSGSRSSGSHSSSRSSGGHRSSGSGFSTRAGSGRTSYSRGNNSMHVHSHNVGHHHHYHNSYYPHVHETRIVRSNFWTTLTSILILLILIGFFFITKSGNSVASTIQRTKLDAGGGYVNDCITDELGWVDNESRTEKELKYFYDKTGVQPVILFKSYDSELQTDSQKTQWAEAYYEENFDQENIFLYVYFAEPNIDDVGYMTYVNGYQTTSVMDSEAVDIFWNYIDRYWYTDMSTDDVLIKTYKQTADTIMKVSTTTKDIVLYGVIGITAIVALAFVLKIFRERRVAEKERAAETEAILSTPLEKIGDTESDDLAEKYLK